MDSQKLIKYTEFIIGEIDHSMIDAGSKKNWYYARELSKLFLKKNPNFLESEFPDEKAALLEASDRYLDLNASFGQPSDMKRAYMKAGWIECYSWIKSHFEPPRQDSTEPLLY